MSTFLTAFTDELAKKPQEKQITCYRYGPTTPRPSLIFTHGASGSMNNAAASTFCSAFADSANSNVIGFDGTMNLQNRVKYFSHVLQTQIEKSGVCVGGRSLGSRAAVVTASLHSDLVQKVVCVSYPLTSPKGDVRDQILVDLPENIQVLFIIGQNDGMCDLNTLQSVRARMQCESWLIVVQGANHGMSISKKRDGRDMTQRVLEVQGAAAASWAQDTPTDQDKRECWIIVDEANKVTRLDWTESITDLEPDKAPIDCGTVRVKSTGKKRKQPIVDLEPEIAPRESGTVCTKSTGKKQKKEVKRGQAH